MSGKEWSMKRNRGIVWWVTIVALVLTTVISAAEVRPKTMLIAPGDRPPNRHADTIDGVEFAVTTERREYRPGDSVPVEFDLINHGMGSVRYDFPTSRQFELRIERVDGTVIRFWPSSIMLDSTSSSFLLSPGTQKSVALGPVSLKGIEADTLVVRAQMAGYPLSAVGVKIHLAGSGGDGPIALEGEVGHPPVLSFNHENKTLLITLDRGRRLTITAFVMTGKKVNKLSREKFLPSGTHVISFNNEKLAGGVVVFKVEGSGFSVSKTINLAR